MHPDLLAYLDWLAGHGVDVARDAEVLALRDHDGQLVPDRSARRTLTLDGIDPIDEHRDPAAGLAADHATEMVAICMPRAAPTGTRFIDVGCGTGVLGVVAHRLGAATIAGTDVDPRAIELAAATLADAGIDESTLYEGSLLDGVPAGERFDLVVANLPHKPCPAGMELFTAQRGGPDGCEPHLSLLDALEGRLAPNGRVLFFLHSLPHPRLLQAYQERLTLVPLAWKRRFLRPGEYGALDAVFLERAERGTSFVPEADGRRYLVACTWLGTVR